MQIKGLIFDFDGLIIDTELPEFLAWKKIYADFGANLELSTWGACVGTSHDAFDPIINLQSQIDIPLNGDEIKEQHRKQSLELIHKQPVLPGVRDYLNSAEDLGLKIGLASSSPKEWVVEHLSRVNLISHFGVICGSDDVQKVKPDPSLYHCAIKKLGIQGNRAIAIEDSRNGVIAAKAAGLFCVAVPNEITREMDFSDADIILKELIQVPLSEIVRRFERT